MKILLFDRSQFHVPIALLLVFFLAGILAVPWVFPEHPKEVSLKDERLVDPAVLDTDTRSDGEKLRSSIARARSLAIDRAAMFSPNPDIEKTPTRTLEIAQAVQAERNEESRKPNREQLLISSLSASEPFRVRVNAALALGNIESIESTRALTRALQDSHSAVRAAAASSLKRIRMSETVGALDRTRSRETTTEVAIAASRVTEDVQTSAEPPRVKSARFSPSRTPTKRAKRYHVYVGAPRSYIGGLPKDLLNYAHGVVTNCVGHLNGVRLVSTTRASDSSNTFNANGRSRAYSLDLSIVGLEKSERGYHAAVSVVLSTHPGKNIRATIRGAADSPKSGSDEQQKRRAIDGAIRSTLGKLRQVMAASASRR